MGETDYLIVGAGSAGAALAGRLSEDGRTRVTLVEAGGRGRWPQTVVPLAYGLSFSDPRLNWMFTTGPNPGMGGRTSYWPRGKVLGGSSAINAMVYSRGQPADFEAWRAAGNPGWGWDEVLSVYRRMEDHPLAGEGAAEAGDGAAHGRGGPVGVSLTDRTAHPLTQAWLAAAAAAGLPASRDLNGISIEGVGAYQMTIRNGRRESSASAYLRRRPNLRVLTGREARRIVFEAGRAVAVEVAGPQGPELLRAPRIVLAAGAVGSPLLLQRSGIGPGALLQGMDLPVLRDAPQVGGNLQDHLCYDFAFRARVPSLNHALRGAGLWRTALTYGLTRRGPLAGGSSQAGGFVRLSEGSAVPDLQLYFSPLTYSYLPAGPKRGVVVDPLPGFTMSASPSKPSSRGRIDLSAPDAGAPPSIRPNYLGTEADVAFLVRAAGLLRRIAAQAPIAGLARAELLPGADVTDAVALERDVRARSYTVYHPCGTCRMGPDPGRDVVGPDLKVHGVEGLWVADASIFPEIPSGNINAPSMMVGEMASDILRRG